jgi:hypothetical protein
MVYIPKPYPCWLYHESEPARVVASYEEHEALGDGWATHPDLLAAAPAPAPVPAPESKSKKKALSHGGK